MDVFVLQAEHLRLLEGAHAAVRAGHEDAHALFAAHGVFGCTAGVAAGGAQDVELFTAALELVLEQVTQELHGHVLEGQRGAVGQGFEPQAVFEVAQRHDLAGAKHFGGIGLGAQGLEVGGRNVVDIERQDLKRQLGVALLVVGLAQLGQLGVVDLRVVLGQVQAAVGRQAFEQDVAKVFAVRVAARGKVQHGVRPACWA